ncbi:pirin [Pseudomonas sp. Leaf127]|uniref:pirin family protein n=1 Tax=Pseudomonas sp. Leaf127 TaxID=1736267 RepID=UPI0007038A4F|nr:pirin family protein [Pseudomonas sp. Leaf127]KQQ55677.1 pirin [Pseudomonas sp. Leaf127]
MTRTLAVQHQAQRRITRQTSGRVHGPITRLMSPGDLGQVLKPFVFLDIFSLQAKGLKSSFGMHPHSGIATVTYMISGDVAYQDSTGATGVLPAGGVEWMRAGNGVWHDATLASDAAMLGFQLWLALPAALENAPAQSLYLDPADVAEDGPVRVLIGQYGAARSPIPAPAGINYLAVNLRDGEHWHYTPPAGHTVAWVAVNAGRLHANGLIEAGELAAFEESEQGIDFVAHGATSFVLGSAIKHPHDLVTGHYSVHTSPAALAQGEAEIQRIGALLGA